MKTDNFAYKSKPLILVEGPTWGDAEFYGHWLLSAAKANKLLEQAKRDDPEFRKAIDTLETCQCLDFGIMGTVFLSKFVDKEFETFVIDPDTEDDLVDFVLMIEMGFFALTGERYQMTLPPNLDMDSVKQAHLKLAATEDEDWIHPERLIVDMPYSKAKKYQSLLRKMNQEQRLADRRALLFLD
jgi:hypothetical protein